jgi:hypothetical protein
MPTRKGQHPIISLPTRVGQSAASPCIGRPYIQLLSFINITGLREMVCRMRRSSTAMMPLTLYKPRAFPLPTQTQTRCIRILHRPSPRHAMSLEARNYATRREALPSSLLSQSLDLKPQSTRRDDTVGPFQLGLTQPTLPDKKMKKWSELSASGKGVYQLLNPKRFLRSRT